MKIYRHIFAMAILYIALLSCSKVNIVKSVTVEFTASDFIEEPETKTTLSGQNFIWSADDVVGIYPNEGAQIYLSMKEGAGTNSASFDGGGWAFRSGAVYYSYYPFIADYYLDRREIPVNFTGQKQNGPNDFRHFGKYDFMYAPVTSVVNNSLSFNYHHLVTIIYVNATLPAGTYKQLTLSAPSDVFVMDGYYDLEAENPSIVPVQSSRELSIGLDNMTLASETTFRIYLVSAPVQLSGTEIAVSVVDSNDKKYVCKKTPSKNYEAGNMYGLGCSSWTTYPQGDIEPITEEDW